MSSHDDIIDLPDDAPRRTVILTAADHYRKALWYLSSTPQVENFHEAYVENLLAAQIHMQIAQLRATVFEESLADVAGLAADDESDMGGLIRVPPGRW